MYRIRKEYSESRLIKYIYDGTKAFEEIKEKYNSWDSKVAFRNKEDCQKYCDYLNEINGITQDME